MSLKYEPVSVEVENLDPEICTLKLDPYTLNPDP